MAGRTLALKQIPDLAYHTVKVNGSLIIFEFETRQEIRKLVDNPLSVSFIKLDLIDCERIDSAGIELLQRLNLKLREKNGRLKLVNANPNVQQVLDICGISTLMDVEIA